MLKPGEWYASHIPGSFYGYYCAARAEADGRATYNGRVFTSEAAAQRYADKRNKETKHA